MNQSMLASLILIIIIIITLTLTTAALFTTI